MTDIELTSEQEDTLVELTDKLSKSAGKPGSLKLEEQPNLALIEWTLYLMDAAIESGDVRSGKKRRTTNKRGRSLKKLKSILGYFPTEKDVKKLFGRAASKNADLIALLTADIQQFDITPE